MFFCDSRVLMRKLVSPFGHPSQVSTQLQLAATYTYLRVRLAKALVRTSVQGFGFPKSLGKVSGLTNEDHGGDGGPVGRRRTGKDKGDT